ncbi:hypothetical protein GCM10018962_80920 [Dactylosporangium matsuzakiense]|uniref:Uncharacterized protein n=1 Tax=Dactylosporangium matsuzakiense TaxID=53360 RepID=A0A9W6NM06_9ACTN|nr:hypothetical protein GCM10017581_031630 [Dactylosporangium matsuzakiense]
MRGHAGGPAAGVDVTGQRAGRLGGPGQGDGGGDAEHGDGGAGQGPPLAVACSAGGRREADGGVPREGYGRYERMATAVWTAA